MRILVGKTFGIGNAVMAVPMIKALSTIGEVDLLLGSGPDDFGSIDILRNLKCYGTMHIDKAPLEIRYDVAVMAIPFDGRWKNGVHFNAERVLDGRPRPDFSPTLGFSSWKKHESSYQLDNARELGYAGPDPTSEFRKIRSPDRYKVYLGIGYKRDSAGFWAKKHWGDERFARFCDEVGRIRPGTLLVGTGNLSDAERAKAIMSQTKNFRFVCSSLPYSIAGTEDCGSYFGNDTGMMHVFASFNRPVYAMNAFPGAEVKNHPLSDRWVFEQFYDEPREPEAVAQDFVKFVWSE